MTDYLDIFLEEREMRLGNEKLKPVIKDGFQTIEVDKKADNIDYLMPYLPALQKIHDFKSAVSEKLGNIPKAIEKGLIKGGVTNPLHYIFGDNKYIEALDKMTDHEAQGLAETFAFEGSKFFGSYLGIGKLLKVGKTKKAIEKAGKYMPEALRVTGSTFLGYKAKEENLADAYTPVGEFLAEYYPALEDMGFDPEDVPQFIKDLQTNPNDSETLGRLKNVIADGPLEAIGVGLGYGLGKLFGKVKSDKQKMDIINGLQKDTKKLFDQQNVGSALNPDGELAKELKHITTQDAVINYVQSPLLFTRNDLVKILKEDKIAQHKSIEDLQNQPRYSIRRNTIEAFRVVGLDKNGQYRPESVTSLSLKPEGLLRSMQMGGPQALPSGSNSLLVRYTVPVNEKNVIGYLPSIGEYTRGTQTRLQKYNAEAIEKLKAKYGSGSGRLKNTKAISEKLLTREAELIADVSDLEPRIVKPFGLSEVQDFHFLNKKEAYDSAMATKSADLMVKERNDKIMDSYKELYANKLRPNALEGFYVQDIMEGKIKKVEDLPTNFTVSSRNDAGMILDEKGNPFPNVEQGENYERAMKQKYIDYYSDIFNPKNYKDVDTNNFYLKSEEIINKLDVKNAKGGHYYNQLLRQGVNKEELYWLGLDKLKGTENRMSKSAIRNIIKNNLVDLQYIHSAPIKSVRKELSERGNEFTVAEPSLFTRKPQDPLSDNVGRQFEGVSADREVAMEVTDAFLRKVRPQAFRDSMRLIDNDSDAQYNFTRIFNEEFEEFLQKEFTYQGDRTMTPEQADKFTSNARETFIKNLNIKEESQYVIPGYKSEDRIYYENGAYKIVYTNGNTEIIPEYELHESMAEKYLNIIKFEAIDGSEIDLIQQQLPKTFEKLADYNSLFSLNIKEIAFDEMFTKFAYVINVEPRGVNVRDEPSMTSVIIYSKDSGDYHFVENPNPTGIINEEHIFERLDEAEMQFDQEVREGIDENVAFVDLQDTSGPMPENARHQREARDSNEEQLKRPEFDLNYQEHLLNAEQFRGDNAYITLFPEQPVFRSTHFSQEFDSDDNLLHIRTEDRFDPDNNKKYLYAFEIQSDWGQMPGRIQRRKERSFMERNSDATEQEIEEFKEKNKKPPFETLDDINAFQKDFATARRQLNLMQQDAEFIHSAITGKRLFGHKPEQMAEFDEPTREIVNFVQGAKDFTEELLRTSGELANSLNRLKRPETSNIAMDIDDSLKDYPNTKLVAQADKITNQLYERMVDTHIKLQQLLTKNLINPTVAMPNFSSVTKLKDIGIYKAINDVELDKDVIKRLARMRLRYSQNPNGLFHGPFISDTNKWTRLAIKKLLTIAHNGDYDGIIFRPGFIAKEEAGTSYDYYSKVVPDVAQSILKELGESKNWNTKINLDYEFLESDKGYVQDIYRRRTRPGEARMDEYMKVANSEYVDQDFLGFRKGIMMTPTLKDKIQRGLSMFSVGGLALTSAERDNEYK